MDQYLENTFLEDLNMLKGIPHAVDDPSLINEVKGQR